MNNTNQSFRPQKPKDPQEAKREKINRIIYITAICLLLSVVIIAAVVSASNRAKKDPVETPNETENKNPSTSPTPSIPNETPNETPSETPNDTPTDDPTSDVVSKLPTFSLPVGSGALSTAHDPDTQVFSPTMEDYRVHLGIDINTEASAPVYAAADGEIVKIWEDVRMGWCMAISHSGDAVTYYKNLDETMASGIEEGVTVRGGQLIGAVGDSAMIESVQEPHLHFELTVGGLQADPLEYFGDEDLNSLKTDAPVEE